MRGGVLVLNNNINTNSFSLNSNSDIKQSKTINTSGLKYSNFLSDDDPSFGFYTNAIDQKNAIFDSRKPIIIVARMFFNGIDSNYVWHVPPEDCETENYNKYSVIQINNPLAYNGKSVSFTYSAKLNNGAKTDYWERSIPIKVKEEASSPTTPPTSSPATPPTSSPTPPTTNPSKPTPTPPSNSNTNKPSNQGGVSAKPSNPSKPNNPTNNVIGNNGLVEDSGLDWWVYAAIAGGSVVLIAGVVTTILLLKKKKSKVNKKVKTQQVVRSNNGPVKTITTSRTIPTSKGGSMPSFKNPPPSNRRK